MSNTEALIIEGKTKKVFKSDAGRVIVESKDDLTAGDGAKHDLLQSKGELSTETTSNVFRLLKSCGLPVAFLEKIDKTHFLAEECSMIPYEVVVRREAHGSYLKRHPELHKGHLFPKLILEYFLKTSGKKWENTDLPKDDPLIIFKKWHAFLYLPDKPIFEQLPFHALREFPLAWTSKIEQIGQIALKAFLILEKAWQPLGKRLVDFKVEFGINSKDELRLADVIDNDSWRLLDNGEYIDKQLYRDGKDLKIVREKYQMVAELTGNFSLPRQQIILWRASDSDDLNPFEEAFAEYEALGSCGIKVVTCSLHKETIRAYKELVNFVQEIPDTVVIAYAGRSNGAGPTLSAHTTVPVITVPAAYKEFPEDIWSSLRAPSDTPVLTVLDPKNAMLAALQILAMRNPKLYAELRLRQEKRLCNMLTL